MPSCPVLVTMTVEPLTGVPKMPATKVAVWAAPRRMVFDSLAVPKLPR